VIICLKEEVIFPNGTVVKRNESGQKTVRYADGTTVSIHSHWHFYSEQIHSGSGNTRAKNLGAVEAT
jgi:hypothetical protein